MTSSMSMLEAELESVRRMGWDLVFEWEDMELCMAQREGAGPGGAAGSSGGRRRRGSQVAAQHGMDVDGEGEGEESAEQRALEQALGEVREELRAEGRAWEDKMRDALGSTCDVRMLARQLQDEYQRFKEFVHDHMDEPDFSARDCADQFRNFDLGANVEPYEDLEKERRALLDLAERNLRQAHPERFPDEEDDSDGVTVMSITRQTKCPFSTRPFENPVKHLPCGHTLDRASVDQILRSQGAPKCPFPGCKQRLDRDQFVADEEMLALMRRRATKESCKRAGGM